MAGKTYNYNWVPSGPENDSMGQSLTFTMSPSDNVDVWAYCGKHGSLGMTSTGDANYSRAISPTLPRSLLKFSGGHSSFRRLPDRTLRV
jgi:hypothetical protein